MEVRGGTADDVAAVAALEQECLGRDAWSEGLVREGLSGRVPTVRYLVAEVGGAVVGHAVASYAGDVVELQRIAVRRQHRRSGVAAALLARVASHAAAGDRVLLEVREDNAGARAFYDRAGFVGLARRERYYADGAAALVLEASVSSLRTASSA